MIRAHVGKKLTQGSIFSWARAEDYGGCGVYGVVITARCDIAHDKAPVCNYLPIVRLDDWLHRDFVSLLCDRCEADARQQLLNTLKSHGVAESVLLAHSPRQVIDVFLPESDQDKSTKKARASALQAAETLVGIENARRSPAHERPVLRLAADFPKLRDDLIRRCVHQQLGGYYFLPTVLPDGELSGFVTLLREVRHLPTAIGDELAVGLDGLAYERLYPNEKGPLSLVRGAFASAVGRLDSPSIEHLMQTFTLLFGRIGLPDPDPHYVATLWQSQPSVQEAAK